MQKEATPDRTNGGLGAFNHCTRVTVKLTIEATEDPKEAIINALQEFFEEFTNAETVCAILPWKRGDFGKGKIDSNTAFPTDFQKMRIYATKLFAGKKK